jgi:hypothetical protein
MNFQQHSQNPAGGVMCDDPIQLLLQASEPVAAPQYPPGLVNYLPTSFLPYQSLGQEYPGTYPQTFSEDPVTRPPPDSNTAQAKALAEIRSSLDELKQAISFLNTKHDNTISSLHAKYDNWISSLHTGHDNAISSLHTKCDGLAATLLEIYDRYAFHQPHSRIKLMETIV